MRAVIQRVTQASVTVEGNVTGEIGQGYVVFLAVGKNDDRDTAVRMAEKIRKLRLMNDQNGKINLSIEDVKGEILVISQFTLYADCSKNRPSFSGAGDPVLAEELYNYFIEICKTKFSKTAHGIFGASMQVSLVNDGPVTIQLTVDN
ncbi:MAG: D-aminoacyl-tRNA deacylase [Oscillospiraceae bacterium]|nr:D-aminoacyl-tRNA deacylase [Oscillospiraceae bacterium]